MIIKIPTKDYNPFSSVVEDEYSILNKLMDTDDIKTDFRYRNNVNEITFVIKEKENIKIPGGKLTIAVFLAIFFGILFRFLPEDILSLY